MSTLDDQLAEMLRELIDRVNKFRQLTMSADGVVTHCTGITDELQKMIDLIEGSDA